MEVIYDEDEMSRLCKDMLYEVNELQQLTDIAIAKGVQNTVTQVEVISQIRGNITELDRLSYLIYIMAKNRKVEDASRYEDNTNTDTNSSDSGDNN